VDLFLIRHAKAVDSLGFQPDAERALTKKGRAQALEVGAALASHGVSFDRIVASPLVRAVQTAELIAVATRYDDALTIDAALVPQAAPVTIQARVLAPNAQCRALALVGHEPALGLLLSSLIGRSGLAMPKLGVVRLGFEEGDELATFRWFVTPKQLTPVHSLDKL
jgi:phosphohistidine phosphatase